MSAENQDFYTDMISIVAHDLKTPISAVKGFIELIQHIGPLNEQQEHYSERALLSLGRMEQLIADLLEYTRIDSSKELKLTECDLRVLIDEALETVGGTAVRRGITIHVAVDSALQPIVADVRLVSQVVNNLVSNAIKYNHDGGNVWITVTDEMAFVRVDVRDTGDGISMEDQKHVFERFFRSKSHSRKKVEGTGLGLAIAKAVIQKHEGHIWVESIPEKGSTFSFTLPRAKAPVSGYSRSHGEHGDYHFEAVDTSSEEIDAVDDDFQETPETPETDSKSDAI